MNTFLSKHGWVSLLGLVAALVCAIASICWSMAWATDWPMYQYNLQRQAANPNDNITPDNARGLDFAWVFPTKGAILAEPIVVGDIVYFGSSDGMFYALNARTSDVLWQVELGRRPSLSECELPALGVGSSALYHRLSDGTAVVYVGGVDGAQNVSLYALDALTGDELWRRALGDAQEAAYTWSSPVIVNNKLFYGIAAQGDAGSPRVGGMGCPYILGKLFVLDPATGDPAPGPNQRTFMDPALKGGGVFSTPAVDLETRTLYLTTGSPQPQLPPGKDFRDYPETNALLALDLETLQTKGRWQLPGPLNGSFDVSTGPILFPNDLSEGPGPRQLVGVGGRNNCFYAFDASDIGRGPIWIQEIGDRNGKNTKDGNGVVSSPAFINGTLYVGGGDRCFYEEDRGCRYIPGSVVALDPASGRIKWRHRTAGRVLGALSGANTGVLYVPSSQNNDNPAERRFEVLDARDGATLYEFNADNRLWSGAAAANDMVFVGSYDGNLYALQLTHDIPADPYTAPSGLDAKPGDGFVTLTWASRADLKAQFTVQRKLYRQIAWKTLADGVTEMAYEDNSVENATIYQYRVIATFSDGVVSEPSNTATVIPSGGVGPRWASMDIDSERPGSADLLKDGSIKISAGGRDIFNEKDRFHYVFQPQTYTSNVRITARLKEVSTTSFFTKAGVDIRAASGRASADPGSPHMAMFYLPPPGTGLENNYRTDYYGGTGFASPHVPANVPVWLRVQRRGRLMEAFYSTDGKRYARMGPPVDYGENKLKFGVTVGLALTAHNEMEITQAVFDGIEISTDVPPQSPFNFRGSTSAEAVTLNWDAAAGADGYLVYRQRDRVGDFRPVTKGPITATMYVDTDVEPHAIYLYRVSAVNRFGEEFADNEVYARIGPQNLEGFLSRDIGPASNPPRPPGDADVNDKGVLNIYAGGRDIWDSADSFRYTYKPMCGSGELIARILYMDRADEWTKAGIMIRENESPGSRHFSIFWTGDHKFRVSWRANTEGGSADNGEDIPGEVGWYMRIVRSGFNFKAYLSEDGKNWRLVGPLQGINLGMGTGALQGLALTSHNDGRGALAKFDFDSIQTGPEGPGNPNDPPLAPGVLSVQGGVRRIELAWGLACNAESYNLYRGTSRDNLMLYEKGLEEIRFTDEDVELGTTYFYQVVGVNRNGVEGERSSIESGEAIEALDHSRGFAAHSDLKENGSAKFVENVARLTEAVNSQRGSIFSLNRVSITSFNTTFTFRLYGGTNPKADGICFVIQSNDPTALGPAGGGLGYGSDQPTGGPGIRNSICVKFDLYDNAGEGTNSTGLFTDGRSPTVRRQGLPDSIPDRSVNLGGGVDLHNPNVKRVVLTYNGTTLNETITDTVTGATFNVSYAVSIRSFVNSDTAYVGFTGGTGGLTAIQDIQTWKFEEAMR